MKNNSSIIIGLQPRLLIYDILYSIKKFNLSFDDIYFKKLNQNKNISTEDKSLIHNVVLSSMRQHFHFNNFIKNYIKKKIKFSEYILLLSASTQIVYLNFKEYAVVNCSVEIAKIKKIYPGFINAVLKNIVANKELLKNTEVNYSNFPEWFIKNTKFLNKDCKKNFVSTFFFKPNLNIVFKQKQDLLKFNTFTKKSSPISLVLNEYESIEKLPMYNEGKWWVQDFSSMLPLELLGKIKNKEILDFCSAPGGKSFQFLSKGGKVTHIEKSKKRAMILKKNLLRLKLNNIENIHCVDALNYKTTKKFDFVIVDAPCSSVGTVRRHPEIFFRNNPPDIKKLILIQKKLLEKASTVVKKNGIIIYMVCSMLDCETNNQIDNFLEKNKNFTLNKFEKINDYKFFFKNEFFFKVTPCKYNDFYIDGFFAAKIKRND